MDSAKKAALEAEFAKIKTKIAEAAALVREAGKIAEASKIKLGNTYGYDEDREYDEDEENDEELQQLRSLEYDLGWELESAMDDAGWRTSAWGC